jgi:nucleoside-diphosphate-sugar epimerase
MSRPTLLITGASGFIGRACLDRLADMEATVHAISSAPTPPGDLAERALWHSCDLLGEDPLPLLREVRPTHLLHLAWITTPGIYWESPANDQWVEASRRLIDRFTRTGGRRVVAAGTCAEYDWTTGRCDEMRTPLKPRGRYGRAKHQLHQWLQEFAATSGVEMAWARVFFNYGPHEPAEKLTASIINHLLAGEFAECTAGLQQRDFLHVDDVGGALAQLTLADVTGPVNIASGQAIAVREVAMTLARLLDAEHLLRLGARPSAADEAPVVQACVDRLRDEVGFTPRWSLEAGLAQTVHWAKRHHRRQC